MTIGGSGGPSYWKGPAMKPASTPQFFGLSRRNFLGRLGITAVAGGAAGGLALPDFCFADEGDSGPVDCGPPPPVKAPASDGRRVVPAVALARDAPAAQREEAATQSSRPGGQGGPGRDALDHQGRQARPIPRLDDRSGRRDDAARTGPPTNWESTIGQSRSTSPISRSIRANCRPCCWPGTTSSS